MGIPTPSSASHSSDGHIDSDSTFALTNTARRLRSNALCSALESMRSLEIDPIGYAIQRTNRIEQTAGVDVWIARTKQTNCRGLTVDDE